jgi:hypothetical protein
LIEEEANLFFVNGLIKNVNELQVKYGRINFIYQLNKMADYND